MSGIRSVFKILTLTCEQSARIASDSYEHELSWTERTALRFHLLGCRWCPRVRKQLESLHRANQRLRDHQKSAACCPDHRLSREAKQRMIERLS